MALLSEQDGISSQAVLRKTGERGAMIGISSDISCLPAVLPLTR